MCGGIFVAIQTAIHITQFKRRFGILVGKTDGSILVLSKFGLKSTVSFSISESKYSAIFAILASVYL